MFAVVRWSTASCCGVNTSWLTSSYRFAGCLAATSLPTRFPPPPVTSPSLAGLNQKPSTQQAGQAEEKGPQSQPLHRPLRVWELGSRNPRLAAFPHVYLCEHVLPLPAATSSPGTAPERNQTYTLGFWLRRF